MRVELHLQLHKPVDLGNQQLSTAAKNANDTAHARTKQLCATKEITSNAIAKMKAMCQHAHAFAEGILDQVADDEDFDKTSCWTAFSGLLDDTKIKSADWADRRKRQASGSSKAVYNIDEFNTSTSSVTMNSPAPNVAYNLTVANGMATPRPRRPSSPPTTSHLIPSSRSRPRSTARARRPRRSASATTSTMTRKTTKRRWTAAATWTTVNTKRRSATPRRIRGKVTPSSNQTVELRAALARAWFGELPPVRFFRWPIPRRL